MQGEQRAHDKPDKRGLSRAVRPDYRHRLPLGELEGIDGQDGMSRTLNHRVFYGNERCGREKLPRTLNIDSARHVPDYELEAGFSESEDAPGAGEVELLGYLLISIS